MNTYKQLINGHAVNLVVFGKQSDKTCFELLKPNAQKELIEAYTAQLSKFDADDMTQAVCDRLGINPAYLVGIGKLKAKEAMEFRNEFMSDVIHSINETLTYAYIDELSARNIHIAEYKADFWSDAA